MGNVAVERRVARQNGFVIGFHLFAAVAVPRHPIRRQQNRGFLHLRSGRGNARHADPKAAFYGDIAEPDVSSAGALGGFYLHIHRVGLGDRFPVEFDGEPRVYAAVIIVETVIQRIDAGFLQIAGKPGGHAGGSFHRIVVALPEIYRQFCFILPADVVEGYGDGEFLAHLHRGGIDEHVDGILDVSLCKAAGLRLGVGAAVGIVAVELVISLEGIGAVRILGDTAVSAAGHPPLRALRFFCGHSRRYERAHHSGRKQCRKPFFCFQIDYLLFSLFFPFSGSGPPRFGTGAFSAFAGAPSEKVHVIVLGLHKKTVPFFV